MKLWTKLAEGGVLVAPGWYFSPYPDAPPVKGEGHLRISFSNAEVRGMYPLLLPSIYVDCSLTLSRGLWRSWVKFSEIFISSDAFRYHIVCEI